MSGLERRDSPAAENTLVSTIVATALADDRARAHAKMAGVVCYLAIGSTRLNRSPAVNLF